MNYNIELVGSSFFVEAKDAKAVKEELEKEKMSVKFDEDKNIVDISINDDRLYNKKDLLDNVSSFVKNNSYLEIIGEDGRQWRWIFQDGQCHEVFPVLIWPDTKQIIVRLSTTNGIEKYPEEFILKVPLNITVGDVNDYIQKYIKTEEDYQPYELMHDLANNFSGSCESIPVEIDVLV